MKIVRELNERERQQALDILSPERKAKALRFRRFEDRSKGMATGVLEAYALWKEFGIPWNELRIQREEQGKPFLPDYSALQYNLSHSGEWIICGVGTQPLGIDVEQTAKYSERLAKRFFHPEETADILAHPVSERPDIFAEYWTMKESFMKLCGTGFAMPLSSFTTERKTGRITVLSDMKEEQKKQLECRGILKGTPRCQQVELESGYKCMVCTMEPQQIENRRVDIAACLSELWESNPTAVKP